MRVALVNLTSGGLSGGYAKYLDAILPLLRRDTRVAVLDVFVPPGVTLGARAAEATRSWPHNDALSGYATLRTQLRQLAPDVVFFPTSRLVRCGMVPTVVMVRNMEPLTVPFGGNTWREGLKNLARARATRVACRQASRVIAVSRYVERFVTERWHLEPGRVGVVYHGIDSPAHGAAPVMPLPLGDRPRFVFTAGSIRPARGLEDLIRAMPILRRAEPGLTLAIAGGVDASGRRYEARMKRLAASLGVDRALVWAGHLSAPEMAWAFQHCAAFVVTSRAEACPNIALEAMSHGASIVSTEQEPMPEFFDSSALYYPPRDAGVLAARLESVLRTAPAVLEERRTQTRRRSETFTWARTAARTVDQLLMAVSRGAVRAAFDRALTD